MLSLVWQDRGQTYIHPSISLVAVSASISFTVGMVHVLWPDTERKVE